MVSPGMRKGRCQGLPPGTEVGPVVGSWTNATLRYDLLRNRRVGMANGWRHHPGRAAPQGVHPAHDRFQRVDPVATCERGIQDAARVIFQAGSHRQFVTSLSSLRPRSTLSSCLTIRPSAIPSVKSRPRGCARKSLARKLQAAEKPVFSTATAAARRGSRRRPAFRRAKRSAPHRQQMEAERCATVNYFRSALYFFSSINFAV
jgi:hypothetical protein